MISAKLINKVKNSLLSKLRYLLFFEMPTIKPQTLSNEFFENVWHELFNTRLNSTSYPYNCTFIPQYNFLGTHYEGSESLYQLNDTLFDMIKWHCTISAYVYLRSFKDNCDLTARVRQLYSKCDYSTTLTKCQYFESNNSYQNYIKYFMKGDHGSYIYKTAFSLIEKDKDTKELTPDSIITNFNAPLFFHILNHGHNLNSALDQITHNNFSDKDKYKNIWIKYLDFADKRNFYSDKLETLNMLEHYNRSKKSDQIKQLSLIDDFILRYRTEQFFFDDFITFAINYYYQNNDIMVNVSPADYVQLIKDYALLPNAFTNKYLFLCALDSRKYKTPYNNQLQNNTGKNDVMAATTNTKPEYSWLTLAKYLTNFLNWITFPAFESAFAYIILNVADESKINEVILSLEQYIESFAKDVYYCKLKMSFASPKNTNDNIDICKRKFNDYETNKITNRSYPHTQDISITNRIINTILNSPDTSDYPFQTPFGINEYHFIPKESTLRSKKVSNLIKDILT